MYHVLSCAFTGRVILPDIGMEREAFG